MKRFVTVVAFALLFIASPSWAVVMPMQRNSATHTMVASSPTPETFRKVVSFIEKKYPGYRQSKRWAVSSEGFSVFFKAEGYLEFSSIGVILGWDGNIFVNENIVGQWDKL